MVRDLAGTTALVTGAAKRIGRAIALALAREGADIVVHYSASQKAALETCREIETLGRRAWPIKADFAGGRPAGYEGLVEKAGNLAGGLGILVNSASIFPASTLNNVALKDFNESMELNAWAPFVLARDFARLYGKGKILNLIDTRVTGYDWNHAAYIWSKHVLMTMTRMMAIEFAPEIAVNGISPGLILPPPGKDEKYLLEMGKTVPLKKLGTAEEVAGAAVFLLTSEFITGEVVRVDGGRHLWEYTRGPHPD
ncbi:MAG: SDR family oxidoreductase [Actinomycetota bacterium]|nr:SDR family oxidoreductase [Actinomycetota bacterium]